VSYTTDKGTTTRWAILDQEGGHPVDERRFWFENLQGPVPPGLRVFDTTYVFLERFYDGQVRHGPGS
jgi:hypothetical protein